MSNLVYVKGTNSVSFAVDGKLTVIPKSHVNFYNILDALETGDMEKVKPLLVDTRQAISNSTDGVIKFRDNQLWFEGEPLHLSITVRIIALIRDGFDVKPLLNFLRNLLDNPSARAKEELYNFLSVNNLPITADGHFIAYKMITADYKDIYTRKMDNSVGATPKMDRADVDPDKHETCSVGLHFAALHYVTSGSYGSRSGGHRLVAVKVNPRDVVAIPTDYNNSKGRACEYTILRELDWDERLPVNTTGFNFLSDKDEADNAGDDGAALVLTPSGAIVPNRASAWTDEEIRKVKRLLAQPDANLASVSRETATVLSRQMCRRQVGRIRDGEVGKHITI